MRWMVAALAALALVGCKDDGKTTADAAGGGYRLEIRAANNEQIYLVTAPDGRTTAAHAGNGASALIDAAAARRLAAIPTGGSDAPEVMSLRVPGFDLRVNSNNTGEGKDAANGDNGQVRLSMGTGSGQRVEINANENGPGDGDDDAHVLITGADERAARDFITGQEELSPEVQTQMLAAVGLSREN